MAGKPMRVREQAVVYLTPTDRELLERLAKETGLARTELFRRGLQRLAEELLTDRQPGASLDYLIGIADEGVDVPPDLSERPDHYLYGGGYAEHERGKEPGKVGRAR